MTKPDQYTAQQMIAALTATHGMVTKAAQKLGCASNTVRRYIEQYPTVAAAQIEAHERLGDELELTLYDEALKKRNTATMIFLAKTKYKARGYVERSEQVNYNVDAELLKRTIDRIEQAGMSASDVFNNILAEIDSANVSAEGAKAQPLD
jgi:hypothetical protein